jgi:hypothetical protein
MMGQTSSSSYLLTYNASQSVLWFFCLYAVLLAWVSGGSRHVYAQAGALISECVQPCHLFLSFSLRILHSLSSPSSCSCLQTSCSWHLCWMWHTLQQVRTEHPQPMGAMHPA